MTVFVLVHSRSVVCWAAVIIYCGSYGSTFFVLKMFRSIQSLNYNNSNECRFTVTRSIKILYDLQVVKFKSMGVWKLAYKLHRHVLPLIYTKFHTQEFYSRMGRKKKPFIDKKNSTTYKLVHRSQHDPLVADQDASQMVLSEIPGMCPL